MSRVDRSRLPAPGPPGRFTFPHIERARLSTGLEVRAVAHRSVPVASLALVVPGGSSSDEAASAGLASLAADLLDEGSAGQSALEVADRIARIGGDLDIEVGHDATVLGFTTLDRFLEPALTLLLEMATEPNLADADFVRVRQLRLERLRQIRDHASALADRAFARVVYQSHPYAHPAYGTIATLGAISLDDVRTYHARMFQPQGATLVIAADRPTDALIALVEQTCAGWTANPAHPPMARDRGRLDPPATPSVRLATVSKPGAAQSELRIGHITTSRATPDYHALVLLNTVLGGQFVSRLNMNLREDKGYTYGVRTGFDLRRGPGPFLLQTSVGTDVTVPALVEALAELRDIRVDRPVTADELALARASVALGYPRGFETVQQVARSVAQLALHDLPDSYFGDFVPALQAVSLDEVRAVARRHLHPERLAVVVVGDMEKVGASLGDVGLGEPVAVEPPI